jgi:hypothetical protein
MFHAPHVALLERQRHTAAVGFTLQLRPGHDLHPGLFAMLIDPQPKRQTDWRPLARLAAAQVAFYAQWLFVIFVSVFDSLLTIQLQDQMMISELNPMGRALLYLDSGQVSYLIIVKGIGTILAASIALMLFWRRPQWGLAVIAGLAIFQLGLLLFLTLDHTN